MSAEYHDAIDRREAQERGQRFEREQAEADSNNLIRTGERNIDMVSFDGFTVEAVFIGPEPVCCCYEIAGDNSECPVHFPKAQVTQ